MGIRQLQTCSGLIQKHLKPKAIVGRQSLKIRYRSSFHCILYAQQIKRGAKSVPLLLEKYSTVFHWLKKKRKKEKDYYYYRNKLIRESHRIRKYLGLSGHEKKRKSMPPSPPVGFSCPWLQKAYILMFQCLVFFSKHL